MIIFLKLYGNFKDILWTLYGHFLNIITMQFNILNKAGKTPPHQSCQKLKLSKVSILKIGLRSLVNLVLVALEPRDTQSLPKSCVQLYRIRSILLTHACCTCAPPKAQPTAMNEANSELVHLGFLMAFGSLALI